jgi:hypothetical protein
MDPLAQTFIVLDTDNQDEGVTGAFLTSCDIFFFEKDANYPVAMEVRNVINGSPGPKILPFGRKTLQSSEVSTSTDGSVATTFTFDSPVYVQGGTEYSICLLANTPDYKVWISDLEHRTLLVMKLQTNLMLVFYLKVQTIVHGHLLQHRI